MPSTKSFDPSRDIPDLSGKVVVVTGGNSGLGLASVVAFALHGPRKIYLTTRSLQKGESALGRIREAAPKANVELIQLDLADFASVTKAANQIAADSDRVDILLLNGGVSAIPHSLTKDGYEIQFGTNHMGHALFTQILMPLLLSTAKQPSSNVRVVAVSSAAQKQFAPKEGLLLDKVKTPMEASGGMALYGTSKLANALFMYQLAKLYPSITTASIHPGVVVTEIWKGDKTQSQLIMALVKPLVGLFGNSAEVGAYNQLWASTSDNVKSGGYYEPVGKGNVDGRWNTNDEMAARLWDWTNKELTEKCGTSWPKVE